MIAHQTGPFLVTGASGQLGRLALDHLLHAGARPVIATTRSPEKLADYAARGVEVRRADFGDPSSLARAFTGIRRMLLISTDDLVPGKRFAAHRAAIAAAAGKRRQRAHVFAARGGRDRSALEFSSRHHAGHDRGGDCFREHHDPEALEPDADHRGAGGRAARGGGSAARSSQFFTG